LHFVKPISNTRIQDIEIIDIRGSGDNTLKLNLNDLLDASTSTNILKVLGDSGDKVNAAGFSVFIVLLFFEFCINTQTSILPL
jgi:hypothetical protein